MENKEEMKLRFCMFIGNKDAVVIENYFVENFGYTDGFLVSERDFLKYKDRVTPPALKAINKYGVKNTLWFNGYPVRAIQNRLA